MKHICAYFAVLLAFVSCSGYEEKPVIRRKRVFALGDTASARPQRITDTSYLEHIFRQYDLVNIHDVDSTIVVRLQYADTANFLHLNLYDGLTHAYFNCETAWRLAGAQYILRMERPDLSIAVLDATRPQHIQQVMWDSLAMHPDLKYNYLSPPYETSLHNYGCAADVTLVDSATGKPLNMGSAFDVFEKISEPVYEKEMLKSGRLDSAAYANRLLLRRVMTRAGMLPIASEWWHFSLCKRPEAMKRFPLIK